MHIQSYCWYPEDWFEPLTISVRQQMTMEQDKMPKKYLKICFTGKLYRCERERVNWLNPFPFRHFRPLLIEKTLSKFNWILHSHQWSCTCHVGLIWKIIDQIFQKITFKDNSSFFGHVGCFEMSRDFWRKCEKIRNPWDKSRVETYCCANRVRFWWKHNAPSLLKTYKLSYWY